MDTKQNKSFQTGVTVLICTYNGKKNLPLTLSYLAKQKVEPRTPWEILLIDNASSDNSAQVASDTWSKYKGQVPLTILRENKPGKDNAIDLGLQKAKYSFVVICDDDNWLQENYVQLAYSIMTKNPEIGMLGGKGVASFEEDCVVPKWFDRFQKYYAVGSQNFLSGEITNYWPVYRFIWGAGAVINLKAYLFLKRNNFKRILTFEKYPAVARSEDVELSLAIWLTGYKLWYDERLIFQHFISKGKLTLSYFMNILVQSVSAIHYLRPYQILMFTGTQNAPSNSFWSQYLVFYLRIFWKHFKSWEHLKILLRIILKKHSEDGVYIDKAITWYELTSVFGLGTKYNSLFKRVSRLQNSLSTSHKI